ncbi:hypothetical protein [Massilia phyllosphaerae]|uniref:hypothetical protein n=1 Tax=Massilia phyllosphaerae TaxID=3106034 RepID=UPI002B1CC5AE|nr:hypothetical protein [Massilia sp. SGZ-792]
MACTSGSVQSVADKTVAAREQIVKLQQMIESQSENLKTKFFSEIDSHLSASHIGDALELAYNSDVKTEYTSEFSLDKIAAVVTKALKAVAVAQDPASKAPALSPEAIAAYTDVVNTVAEAAKSSSSSSASLSFSMTRLSPGLFAFLSASSINIKDEDTFGTEAITTTAIYYRFMQSIDDISNEAKFGEALIDASNLINMKRLQAALTDQLANGTIDLDTWSTKDDKYSEAVKRIETRLDADGTIPRLQPVLVGVQFNIKNPNDDIARGSIDRLGKMGPQYQKVVDLTKSRLLKGYY